MSSTLDGGAGDDSAFLQNGGEAPLTLRMSGNLQTSAAVKSGGKTVATLKKIERLNVDGGDGNDVLFGGTGRNTLNGGLGANKITGNIGDDEIGVALDKKKDTVKGGDGIDRLTLSPTGDEFGGGPETTENVVMSGTLANLTVKLGNATSLTATKIESVVVVTGSGDDTLFGGDKDDRFTIARGADSVKAGDGDDRITSILDQKLDKIDGGGGGGENRLSLNIGDFNLVIKMKAVGESGFTATVGGKNAMEASRLHSVEFFTASSGADTLVGLKGDDTLSGSDGDDTLSGRGGDDQISGGSGDDMLSGGGGNDKLVGGGGKDTFDGGEGSDDADLSGLSVDTRLELKLVKNKTVQATVNGDTVATLKDIENLTGTSGRDQLTGDTGKNRIAGGRGDDVLDGGKGADTVIFATAFGFGDGFTLTLNGAKDAKATYTDFLGTTETDTVRNFENVIGSDGADRITGDAGESSLLGSGGEDVLKGGGGNDRLDGGGEGPFGFDEKDTMEGGRGDDTYVVDNEKDIVREAKGQGSDTVLVATSKYELAAKQEIEVLKARTPDNTFGFSISTILVGNEFGNTIAGGNSRDTLTGGKGRDTFLFDAELSDRNFDDITDFSHTLDGFQLDHDVFKGLTAKKGLTKEAFALFDGQKPKEGLEDNDRILYDKARGDVFFDRDGAGGKYEAVKFAHLDKLPGAKNHPTLDHTDFFVV